MPRVSPRFARNFPVVLLLLLPLDSIPISATYVYVLREVLLLDSDSITGTALEES